MRPPAGGNRFIAEPGGSRWRARRRDRFGHPRAEALHRRRVPRLHHGQHHQDRRSDIRVTRIGTIAAGGGGGRFCARQNSRPLFRPLSASPEFLMSRGSQGCPSPCFLVEIPASNCWSSISLPDSSLFVFQGAAAGPHRDGSGGGVRVRRGPRVHRRDHAAARSRTVNGSNRWDERGAGRPGVAWLTC